MAERQPMSGCAVTAIVAGVVLLLATLVGGGLLVMFWGVRVSEAPPPTVEAQPEPTPPPPGESEER